jgi:hypothetical protein
MQQAALRHTHVGSTLHKVDCKFKLQVDCWCSNIRLTSLYKGSYQCSPVLGFACCCCSLRFICRLSLGCGLVALAFSHVYGCLRRPVGQRRSAKTHAIFLQAESLQGFLSGAFEPLRCLFPILSWIPFSVGLCADPIGAS